MSLEVPAGVSFSIAKIRSHHCRRNWRARASCFPCRARRNHISPLSCSATAGRRCCRSGQSTEGAAATSWKACNTIHLPALAMRSTSMESGSATSCGTRLSSSQPPRGWGRSPSPTRTPRSWRWAGSGSSDARWSSPSTWARRSASVVGSRRLSVWCPARAPATCKSDNVTSVVCRMNELNCVNT